MELYLYKLFVIINQQRERKNQKHLAIFVPKPIYSKINNLQTYLYNKTTNKSPNLKSRKKPKERINEPKVKEYIKGMILNKFNISSLKYTPLNPFMIECFNNLEYLSLKYNLIRNLHFIKYLPNLFYLDASNNPLEDIEILNIKNVFGYLKLSLESFNEKQILNINGLCCGILELYLYDESLLTIFKNNNPFICLFNDKINYFYDKVLADEDKVTRKARRYSFKSRKMLIDKFIFGRENNDKQKGNNGNKQNNKQKEEIFNEKYSKDNNKNKRKIKRANSIKLKYNFINCYIYGFKPIKTLKEIKESRDIEDKTKNKGLLKIKNFFDEYNGKLITICNNCNTRDRNAKVPVKAKYLKTYKIYLLLEKKKLILLNDIYQKLSIFNEDKKSDKFFIYKKEYMNVNPYIDSIEMLQLKDYVKLIDSNPSIALIVLIVLLFYCIGIISNLMMYTLIKHLLVKYYKYFYLNKLPKFENENTNYHFLSYYFDNYENIKEKFNSTDIKDKKTLDILSILEMKKLILKSNVLFSQKRCYKNFDIYDQDRFIEQIKLLVLLNIKEEVLILLNYLYDFIIYDNIEKLLINEGYPNEYSCIVKLKEILEKNKSSLNEIDICERKYQKNQIERLYNKFYFKLYKVEEIKNSKFDFKFNKKKNDIKIITNNDNDDYKNIEDIDDVNKYLIINNKNDTEHIQYYETITNGQIFKNIKISNSFKSPPSIKSCAKHYYYLNFKKYLNEKNENNNKDISNLTNKLKSKNIKDIINSEKITKNKNLLLKISNNLKLNKNKKLSNTKLLFKNKYNEINKRFKKVSKETNTLMLKTFSNNMAKRTDFFEKKLSEKNLNEKSYSSNKHKDKITTINNIEDWFDLINERNKKIYIRNIAKSSSLRNAERIYSKKRKDFFFTLNNDNYINDRRFRRDKKFNSKNANINPDYNSIPSLNIKKYNQKEMSRIILNYKIKKNKVYSKTIDKNV